MCILHEFAAWGVQADFAAVAFHPAPFLLAWPIGVIVIDAVVVLAQHGQV